MGWGGNAKLFTEKQMTNGEGVLVPGDSAES